MTKKSVFAEAKRQIQAIARADRYLVRKLKRKCDWDDPGDVAVWRRERRRYAKISRIPRSYICPRCKEKKPSPSSWAMTEGTMMCRGCVQRSDIDEENEHVIEMPILVDIGDRYRVDGPKIRNARLNAGSTVSQAAETLGWSQSYQSRIETNYVTTIDKEAYDKIKDLFNIRLNKEPLYKVDDDVLVQLREAVGVSRNEISRRCGWRWSKYESVEAGKAMDRYEAAQLLKGLASIGIRTQDEVI